jgi:hypothetical protein
MKKAMAVVEAEKEEIATQMKKAVAVMEAEKDEETKKAIAAAVAEGESSGRTVSAEAAKKELEDLESKYQAKLEEAANKAKALEGAASAEKLQAAIAAAEKKKDEEAALQMKALREELEAEKANEVEAAMGKAIEDTVGAYAVKSAGQMAEVEQKLQAVVAESEAKLQAKDAQLVSIQGQVTEFAKAEVEEAKKEFEKQKREEVMAKQREYEGLIDDANNERDAYQETYKKEMKKRVKIHNELMDLKGNIRVVCRIRPKLPPDCKTGQDQIVASFPSDEQVRIMHDLDGAASTTFEFDRCFGEHVPHARQFSASRIL